MKNEKVVGDAASVDKNDAAGYPAKLHKKNEKHFCKAARVSGDINILHAESAANESNALGEPSSSLTAVISHVSTDGQEDGVDQSLLFRCNRSPTSSIFQWALNRRACSCSTLKGVQKHSTRANTTICHDYPG